MRLVPDSSVIVPALTDDGDLGSRTRETMRGKRLVAPAGVDLEVISALRGLLFGGEIEGHVAEKAVDDLSRMRMVRVPTTRLHQRAWNLRHNLASYDACFVALAENLRAPLFTLDRGIIGAHGPECEFLTVE